MNLNDQLRKKAWLPPDYQTKLEAAFPAIAEKLLETVRPGMLSVRIGVPSKDHADILANKLSAEGCDVEACGGGFCGAYVAVHVLHGTDVFLMGHKHFSLDGEFQIIPEQTKP